MPLTCAAVLAAALAGAEAFLCFVDHTMRPVMERLVLIYQRETGQQVQLDFADERGVQLVPLARAPGPPIETTFVQVVIDEVYPGTTYDDTCLAEVEVWGQTR